MDKIRVVLLRENAKMPRREHRSDAGADVFLAMDEEFRGKYECATNRPSVRLEAGASAILPTGIKIEVPEGYMVEVKNKSSVAAKRQLVVGACVIDSGYAGELFVNLHNIGEDYQWIDDGQKIAQIVVIPVETPEFEGIEPDELYDNMKSERGEGGFGSTGDK